MYIFTRLNNELAYGRIKYVPTNAEIDLLNRAIQSAAFSNQRFRVGAAHATAKQPNCEHRHAEINLLLSNPKPGKRVAVARLGRAGDWRCSYPCLACATALSKAGVRRVTCFDEGGQPVSLDL